MKALWTLITLACVGFTVNAAEPTTLPAKALVGYDFLNQLRTTLKKGTPTEKEMALETIRVLKPLALIPDLIEAIEDTTALPEHVSEKCITGWGFVFHQAATVLGEIARDLDGVEIGLKPNMRGYKPYSFHDDLDQGLKLKEAGRLAEVKKNWAKWWDETRK